jgi:acetolactate synthase I/II/III large subunit
MRVISIGGQVVTSLIGKDAFQECDMMGMTNPVTKHNFLDGFSGEWADWSASIRERRAICNRCIKDEKSDALTPKQVMAALNHVLDATDVVATGVGQHQMFATHYLYREHPRTFVTSGGAGTMGFGLPAAIGASVGAPEVTVFAVDGDGSLQMTIQELGTLATLSSKVVLLILDNGYLGMVRQWQELFHDRRYSQVKLPTSPDFVKIAEAYGIAGRFVDTSEALKEALAAAESSDKSMVLHIVVEPESNIEPMIPPGGKVTDFGGYCIAAPGQFFTESELAGAGKGEDEA